MVWLEQCNEPWITSASSHVHMSQVVMVFQSFYIIGPSQWGCGLMGTSNSWSLAFKHIGTTHWLNVQTQKGQLAPSQVKRRKINTFKWRKRPNMGWKSNFTFLSLLLEGTHLSSKMTKVVGARRRWPDWLPSWVSHCSQAVCSPRNSINLPKLLLCSLVFICWFP